MAEPLKSKIIAVIPCLDEEQFIGDIVARTKRHVDRVIVVDDGSSDNTAQVAKAAGAEVIRHKTRCGPGAATRSGLEMARTSDADVTVTLDGDAQHNPDEIPRIVKPILRKQADLVIGSRFVKTRDKEPHPRPTHASRMPRYRKLGIDIVTYLYNVGARMKVSDSQSCFRAYSRRLLEALNVTDDGFGFSIEILVQARKKGFIFAESPISCIYHSKSSSIHPVTHGIGLVLSVIRHRIRWCS
ncbi:MAG TPA: glycosyltransferase family 2 protein [Dehalococcoidia bacterium]|nr:glycosyltransferase family 2 protein [Dehalococcoidia bacterium]